jgi:hypothetical protein
MDFPEKIESNGRFQFRGGEKPMRAQRSSNSNASYAPKASRQSSLAAGFGLADPSSGKLKHWDQLLQAGCA